MPFAVAPLNDAISAVISYRSAAHRALEAEGLSPGLAVHFANAYTIALAEQDPELGALFSRDRATVFTDGMPVAWVGRRGYPELASDWERVYGPDVMTGVLAGSTSGGPTHFLLGGSEEALEALQIQIRDRFPGAKVVGAESPPFRPATGEELAARDQRISDSGADLVWVGLGTPKQDFEVARLAESLPVTALAVGAAFDFLAGAKKQAPMWMQRSGTEWIFRLATEPRRLLKRYLWGNPKFVLAAARTPGLRARRSDTGPRRSLGR